MDGIKLDIFRKVNHMQKSRTKILNCQRVGNFVGYIWNNDVFKEKYKRAKEKSVIKDLRTWTF